MSLCSGGLAKHTSIYWLACRIWKGFKVGVDEDATIGRVKGLIDALVGVAAYASRHKNYRLETYAVQLNECVVLGRRRKSRVKGKTIPPVDLASYRQWKATACVEAESSTTRVAEDNLPCTPEAHRLLV